MTRGEAPRVPWGRRAATASVPHAGLAPCTRPSTIPLWRTDLMALGKRAFFATRMMPDWTIVVRLICGEKIEGQMRTLAMAQHKRARAVELLLEGSSYADVARQVGYTHRGSAHRAVRQALHDREVTAI